MSVLATKTTPTKKGINDREENSLRRGTKNTLSMTKESRYLSPASSSVCNYSGGGDGRRQVDSMRSGNGNGAHEEWQRRPRAQRSLSRKEGGPATPGGGGDDYVGDELPPQQHGGSGCLKRQSGGGGGYPGNGGGGDGGGEALAAATAM